MVKKRVFSGKRKKKPTFFPSAGLRADCEHIKLELLELKEPTQREALLREEMVRLGPGYVNSKCLSLVFEPWDV